MKTKKTKRNGKPDPTILAGVIKRIVEVADPERIVLFGSAARGTMGPDSDLDLLVIKAGKFNRDRVTRNIYCNLSGEIGVDAIVVTPEDVERYRNSFCLVICPALKEGKVVYEAKAIPSGRSARVDSPSEKQPGVGSKRRPRR